MVPNGTLARFNGGGPNQGIKPKRDYAWVSNLGRRSFRPGDYLIFAISMGGAPLLGGPGNGNLLPLRWHCSRPRYSEVGNMRWEKSPVYTYVTFSRFIIKKKDPVQCKQRGGSSSGSSGSSSSRLS
jgi:hypothetical protein